MSVSKGAKAPVCSFCGAPMVDGISIHAAGFEEDAVYFCCEDHLDAWAVENGGD